MVCCIFGDGAINRGPFLEGLNWSQVFGLPIVFVCEDNGFASTTRTESMTAGPGPGARAEALGLPSLTVDGNDVLALAEAATEVFDRVRAQREPEFIHVKTYRLAGHTASDPATYRSSEEVDAHWKQDPVSRLRELLTVAGVATADLDALATAADEEMRRVLDTARETPFPDAEQAFRDVQDVGDPRVEAY